MFIFVKESGIYIDYDKMYQLIKLKNNNYEIVEVKKEKIEEEGKKEKQEDKISSDLNLDEQKLTIPSKHEKYSIIHLNDLFEKKIKRNIIINVFVIWLLLKIFYPNFIIGIVEIC